MASSPPSKVLTGLADQSLSEPIRSETSCAVSGLSSHSTSMTACSASLIRSAISTRSRTDYVCNLVDYVCSQWGERLMNGGDAKSRLAALKQAAAGDPDICRA